MISHATPVKLPALSAKPPEAWYSVPRNPAVFFEPMEPWLRAAMSTTTLARDAEVQLLRIDRVLRSTVLRVDISAAAFFDLADGPAFHDDSDVVEVSDVIEDDNQPWPFAVYPDEVWH